MVEEGKSFCIFWTISELWNISFPKKKLFCCSRKLLIVSLCCFCFFFFPAKHKLLSGKESSTGATTQNSLSTQLRVTHAYVRKPTGSPFFSVSTVNHIWAVQTLSSKPSHHSRTIKYMYRNDKKPREHFYHHLLFWPNVCATTRLSKIVDLKAD